MINQLLRLVSPDVVEQAFKNNPGAAIEILQKFATFRLIGEALTREQQVILSNNIKYVNHYLVSEDGKASIRIWAEGFVEFVDRAKKEAAQIIKNQQEAESARLAANAKALEELKQKDIDRVALALKEAEAAKAKLDLETSIRKELEATIRKELEEKTKTKVVTE